MKYSREIIDAVKLLKDGGIILYPTDTIWGIGCDATNAEAVKKIYELKQREDHKSMLVVADSAEMVADHLEEMPSMAWDLLEAATEPLTIIYPEARGLANNLTGPDGSIGIRICNAEFCNQLIKAFGRPLVSTSANISGEPFPKNYDGIDIRIKEGVDISCGKDEPLAANPKPSSIIKLGKNNEIQIIRE